MRVAIGGRKSLVVNQLTGAVLIVDDAWWDQLGLGWIEKPIAPETLPDCPCHYGDVLAMRPDLMSAEELHLFGDKDGMDFFLTRKRYQRYLDRITAFGERFARERQTTFFVTPQTQKTGCPLDCVYCFQKKAEPQAERLIEEGNVPAIEHFIRRYRDAKALRDERICIQLFGGEPVQARFYEFWRRILEMVKRNGWRWTPVTSGATFTPEFFDLFEEFAPYGLQEFNITFDAVPEGQNLLRPFKSGQGTHAAIKANVNELLRRGLPVKIKTVLGRDNIRHYRQHLSNMMEWGWHRGNMVIETNVVFPFGGTDTRGQAIPEDDVVLEVVAAFRDEPFRELIPIIRTEGKKLTGYLANAFGLPFPQSEALRRGKPVFEAYPYHAFCNPGKGVTYNIAPDGTLRTCNWMDGREGFGEGNIFDPALNVAELGRYRSFVSCHPHCSKCDISTLCGGSCAIDIQQAPSSHYLHCRENYGGVIERFVRGCISRGWVDASLGERPYKVLRTSFDFDYRYRDRFDAGSRISDPHQLAAMAGYGTD